MMVKSRATAAILRVLHLKYLLLLPFLDKEMKDQDIQLRTLHIYIFIALFYKQLAE